MKGKAVGGVTGHYAGHRAVVGEIGFCIVGPHMGKQHAPELAAQPTPQAAH